MNRSSIIVRACVSAAALAVGMLLVLPGTAEACAVCFQAKTDASRIAFIATTAFMTVLPLLLIGGVAYWVRSRFVAAQTTDSTGEARVRSLGSGNSKIVSFAIIS